MFMWLHHHNSMNRVSISCPVIHQLNEEVLSCMSSTLVMTASDKPEWAIPTHSSRAQGGRILKPTISTLTGPFWMTADTTPDNIQGHSVLNKPTEPDLALSGVDGHSVHDIVDTQLIQRQRWISWVYGRKKNEDTISTYSFMRL